MQILHVMDAGQPQHGQNVMQMEQKAAKCHHETVNLASVQLQIGMLSLMRKKSLAGTPIQGLNVPQE
jgi:hypothetical protein